MHIKFWNIADMFEETDSEGEGEASEADPEDDVDMGGVDEDADLSVYKLPKAQKR